MKIIVVLVLLIIVGSLGSALYYLVVDRDRSPRTVRALTLRITLSLVLFALLIVAFATGLIRPHGLNPGSGSAPSADRSPSTRPPAGP